MWIVRNLGLVGLYKGASACLLRDGECAKILFEASLTSPSSLLRHLLPRIQPSEEGLLRRELSEEAGRSPDVDSRCHRRYARCLPHYTMRRDQDTSASRGTQGRRYLQWSARLREKDLAARRLEGLLQGWTSPYHAIIASVRFYPGRLRSFAAK